VASVGRWDPGRRRTDGENSHPGSRLGDPTGPLGSRHRDHSRRPTLARRMGPLGRAPYTVQHFSLRRMLEEHQDLVPRTGRALTSLPTEPFPIIVT